MKNLLTVTALFACSMFAACGSTKPFAALPIEDDAEAVSNVVITDSDLLDLIRIGNPGVARLDGSNLLRVIVPIRNIGDETLQVRVQTSFLDLQKRPIGDETNAQVLILSPGMTLNHSVTSSKTEARDWSLRIMPNNRS